MKQKGFTLIEILAVIILIGIVSVITVPVVKNITKDAKQKGYEKQVNTVLESAKNWAVVNTQLLPEANEPILVKMDTLKKEGLLENKKIIDPIKNKEMNGCAEISYNEEFNQYEYEYNDSCILDGPGELFRLSTISSDLDVDSVDKCATDRTKCEAGTAFAINVNDTTIEKFYVLNDDGNTVTLLLNRNLYPEGNTTNPNVEWINYEDYQAVGERNFSDGSNWNSCSGDNIHGPITALRALKERTSNWTNINEYDYELAYGTGTYSKDYVKNVRARLPEKSDVNSFLGQPFLYVNIRRYGDDNTYGYWLSDAVTTVGGCAESNAYVVFESPAFGPGFINNIITSNSTMGIRPVISLSKTYSATIY